MRASKVPKPTTCTLPPLATSSFTVSKVAEIAFSTSFLVKPAFSATAAINSVLLKLKYLDADNDKRRQIAKYYIDNITHPDITLPKVTDWDAHVMHLFVIRTSRRDELQQYLANNGVQTLIHYPIPPHKQDAYKEWNDLSFPITEKIHREVLSLPLSPVMSKEEVEKVVEIGRAHV